MVAAVQKNVLRFLRVLHQTPRAMGLEEFARANSSLADARTLYRWHADLADDLLYYPSVTFHALGLEHVHLFIEQPAPVWKTFPYAIRGEWVASRPHQEVLYLHCLVPRTHEEDLALLCTQAAGRTAASITRITTRDGWQVLRDPSTPTADPVPVTALSAAEQDVWDIIERLPLLIPVIFETVEHRQSLPAIWDAIYARLGKRTWEYLPRFARRLPTNGKCYVKECFALLNHTGLFRQNMIRYRPLSAAGLPMVLRVDGHDLSTVINAVTPHSPLTEVYPIGTDAALVRLVSTQSMTQQVFTSTPILPRITDWYVIDALRNEREPIAARFAYELLFDPTTTEWVSPHDALQPFRGDS
ncbi:MAG TPA: hypothetical protein VGO08_03915 [Burkholderiales bacterium]|jgi:hypothetical protein|nr:hypothetical protein [Burkholderiales bacterium]